MALSQTTKAIAEYLGSELDGYSFAEGGKSGEIFRNVLPSNPDEAILIENSGGTINNSRYGYDNSSIRVLVRGTQDPRGVENTAYNVIDCMQTFRGNMNGILVAYAELNNGPVNIGRDDNNRHRFSINFTLNVRNNTKNRK